jgi:23S rRNA pseudouridine2604 synthase
MTEEVRLSKRMAELGLCSRREADEYIAKGWVKVDGMVVNVLGSKVGLGAKITLDPQARASQQQLATILLNKPIGYVSGQAEDGYQPAVTLIQPVNQWSGDASGKRFFSAMLKGLAPAGRLDIDSTGLLVLTQDGRIAKQLIGEDSGIEKEYLVRVSFGKVVLNVRDVFPADQLDRLCHGLSLDGKLLKPAQVEWQNAEQLRFVLREGKKRQIRRMCELVGLKVTALKRVRMGQVRLGDLPIGKWRFQAENERF